MNLGQPDLRLDRDAAPFVKSELVQVVFARVQINIGVTMRW